MTTVSPVNNNGSMSNTGNSGGGGGSTTNTIVPPKPGVSLLDANVYATKKTIAQGLLDVALLTANASQLKYLLQAGKEHEFYYVMMVLIILSILLQVCLGVVILLKGRRDINDEAQQEQAQWLNNVAVWLVFASTVVHVFLSVFTIEPKEQAPFPTFEFQEMGNESLSSSTFDYDNS